MRIPNFHAQHEQYRRNWVRFFRRTVPDVVWQRLAKDHPAPRDRRVRWVAAYLIMAWVVIGWSLQTTLTGRAGEVRQWLARRFPARWRPGRTYQGLLKATLRTRLDLFQCFWRHLRPKAVKRLGHAKTWYGWTVLAADGSRFDAPRTRANAKHLRRAGRPGNDSQPGVGALRAPYRRRRPKSSRYWPRKKNDHPPGPPKLHSLSRHEIARIAAIRIRS